MMNEKNLKGFLSIAKNVAVAAGEFLRQSNEALKKVNLEIGRDVKIEADLQSEAIIIDLLRKQTKFSILSEEKGLIEGKDKELMWIVDPVDGSLNYSKGLPLCCVSVGLWKKDEPILGVIYDFYRSEIFSGIAIAQKGAWLNGAPIQVSKIQEKTKAVLCTGFPIKTDFSRERIATFLEQVCVFKKIRLLGTAALSMAYVAAGRVEGYHENDIMWWDVAGGIPIILGAGGKIIKLEKTADAHSFNVYLTNGSIL